MENQALISVIIPVCNVEAYLRECIDSVLKQTCGNFEIILVDDGSTDSSGQICDEYVEKDERITVIHQKNGGLSVARNTGLSHAEGKYVYFLDSDDYIAPNALKILYSAAEKENSEIVFFDAVSFTDTPDFTVKQSYVRKNAYEADTGYGVFKALTRNNDFHSAVPLLFINRAFLLNSELKFIPRILHEDMVFTYQAFCMASRVSQCREALYYRRYRKDSIMTSKKTAKHFLSCVTVCRLNTDFTEKAASGDSAAAYEYVARCAFNVFNVYEKLSRHDKGEVKKELADFRKFVSEKGAFGNTALKMRCYGKVFWFIYKVFEKTAGRLVKGKK